ncbi:TIGR01906 family membrane protein [Clostridium brassicae]|uniref:TIGR01906 family membrane protein n=1 Tax=Clostridium brassicae TaxID=2999072 RepID=A0ABT4D404_9CLOT|nr:TIGR01906 family membrane protein [Clostridium brassicae]MCY6957007.1 TIGR01906 family membrane protein [Clostridium brassicae]
MKKISIKNTSVLQIVLTLFTVLLIISINIKVVVNFKPLYYIDIKSLDIEKNANLNIDEIKSNYNYVIDYIQKHKIEEFNLPTLNSSINGKLHFQDVKSIFNKIDYLLLISIFIVSSYLYFIKNKNYIFLKWSYNILFFMHLLLILSFLFDFSKSFNTFHQLFFRNDYWVLDANLDPIINIMPETYFLHCAIFIIALNIISAIIIYILHNFRNNS